VFVLSFNVAPYFQVKKVDFSNLIPDLFSNYDRKSTSPSMRLPNYEKLPYAKSLYLNPPRKKSSENPILAENSPRKISFREFFLNDSHYFLSTNTFSSIISDQFSNSLKPPAPPQKFFSKFPSMKRFSLNLSFILESSTIYVFTSILICSI